jgi:hypothetical protein
MLEPNTAAPSRGKLLLRYTAATPNDVDCVIGKVLFQDMKGVRSVFGKQFENNLHSVFFSVIILFILLYHFIFIC